MLELIPSFLSKECYISAVMPSTHCACGQPRRPNQANCRRCHSEEQKRYRQRRKEELRQLMGWLERLTQPHPPTREHFELKGTGPWVEFLTAEDQRICGLVIGFLPSDRVRVLADSGFLHNISLDQIVGQSRNLWTEIAAPKL